MLVSRAGCTCGYIVGGGSCNVCKVKMPLRSVGPVPAIEILQPDRLLGYGWYLVLCGMHVVWSMVVLGQWRLRC